MGYAEVAVNSPVARRQPFSYSIPPGLIIKAGQSVWVPFGPRVLQGIVLELTDYPAVPETRDIAGIIDPQPLISPTQIQLARWMSQYYLSSLFDAISLMLPPGFGRKPVTFLQLPAETPNNDDFHLSTDEKQVLHLLKTEGRVSLKLLEESLGQNKARTVINHLVHLGMVAKIEELERIKIKPKYLPYVKLAVDPEFARQVAGNLAVKASKQAAVLEVLADSPSPIPSGTILRDTSCSTATVKALEAKGLITIEHLRVLRDPLLNYQYHPEVSHILTGPQEAALTQIRQELKQSNKGSPRAFLLHGVTGSGKTEVYLQSLAEAIALGKRGIILVPEIALTPQTISRFASRFPGQVAVLHSRLSLGERFDVWQKIKEGSFDVVIGPASALFAPQPDLGIIVIDEEHEWTYKQDEQAPCYHAREVALQLSAHNDAIVVMGSATPDVESYHRADLGEYHLIQLPDRITEKGVTQLPEIEVVDMRLELKEGNRSIFSRSLQQALAETLYANQQAILFLNRRGTATFVQCRTCGLAIKCPGCDLPFTYHGSQEKLICHQCNRSKPVPTLCPECGSGRIKFLGIGTERIEAEITNLLPTARTLRWDRDVTREKDSHEAIARSFRAHEADILIGTQMIAKGLDFPEVTLAGIVSADTVLHFPDFRSPERTFQLLSQVAGRAGRGTSPGRAIVQTYTPEHYSIALAAKHDYSSFYRQEMAYRRRYGNPPYSRLVILIYVNANYERCQQETRKMYQRLKEKIDSEGLELDLIGPSPMFFGRIRGRFRWQIILRGANPVLPLADLSLPKNWVVDVDPIGLL